MDKLQMRDWIASLEQVVDNKLKRWKKENKIENGESVQMRWQYQHTHVHLDVFWEDQKEFVSLHYISPRATHAFRWHGLKDETFNNVMDRIGNLAQVTMYPIDDIRANG